MALGVDPDAVGIALQYPGRRGDRGRCLPRGENRQLRVAGPVVLEFKQIDPVIEPGLFNFGV
jgi:hypothetical protein